MEILSYGRTQWQPADPSPRGALHARLGGEKGQYEAHDSLRASTMFIFAALAAGSSPPISPIARANARQ